MTQSLQWTLTLLASAVALQHCTDMLTDALCVVAAGVAIGKIVLLESGP